LDHLKEFGSVLKEYGRPTDDDDIKGNLKTALGEWMDPHVHLDLETEFGVRFVDEHD
jgi:hypothetical protein